MSMEVWTLVELSENAVKDVSLEVINAGRMLAQDLGGTVTAVVLAENKKLALESLIHFGADRVLRLSGPQFALWNVEIVLAILIPLIQKRNPFAILVSSSIHGKEFAGGLSAKINCPLATDCLSLKKEREGLIVSRPIHSGKAISTIKLSGARPLILTLRANIFRGKPDPSRKVANKAKVEEISPDFDIPLNLKVREVVKEAGTDLDITEARIVVSGGLGMQTPENFSCLEELAKVLGAAVGASRPTVDSGWRPYSNQVGQTGRTVSPDLYIACGISGSVQHVAGMSSSKCIVAINIDPHAPIFSLADYGIVGDALQIVPIMTQEFKNLLGN